MTEPQESGHGECPTERHRGQPRSGQPLCPSQGPGPPPPAWVLPASYCQLPREGRGPANTFTVGWALPTLALLGANLPAACKEKAALLCAVLLTMCLCCIHLSCLPQCLCPLHLNAPIHPAHPNAPIHAGELWWSCPPRIFNVLFYPAVQ